MKLTHYTTQNTIAKPKGKDMVSINAKSGSISFSKTFMVATGWSAGDTIAFCQDEQRPQDWYVCASPEGWPMRNKAGGSFLVQNSHIARQVLLSAAIGKDSHTFLMATQPTKTEDNPEADYYAILTKS